MKTPNTEHPVAARLAQVGAEFGHGFALDLSRITTALAAMGDPHLRLPPVIHVAGTNGKGSTCAFLRAIAEAAGLRAHVFTSPHLIRPNERIRLNGVLVSDAAFIAALDQVAATGATVTYFEAVTAAAFQLFAQTPADLVILEVGLGGRFDATNVIPHPAVTVITPVDLDHQAFLGPDIKTIAREKAGILKAGAPGVIARQAMEGSASIEAEAQRVGAPLLRCGVEWDAWMQHGRLVVQTQDRLLDLAPPGLTGAHQVENAGAAVVAALALHDQRITDDALSAGVANAYWPARMQRLKGGALGAIAAAEDAELWLDGGHNPHAARALARALDGLALRDPRPVTAILGMLANKDLAGFLGPLRGKIARVIAVPIHASQSGRLPEDVAAEARALGFDATTAPDLTKATTAASKGGGRVLICGSLYLAGEALALSDGVT
jgi:dihydrofolate synthase/folylpolyglutamate synthase